MDIGPNFRRPALVRRRIGGSSGRCPGSYRAGNEFLSLAVIRLPEARNALGAVNRGRRPER